jgi:hypothetical protein
MFHLRCLLSIGLWLFLGYWLHHCYPHDGLSTSGELTIAIVALMPALRPWPWPGATTLELRIGRSAYQGQQIQLDLYPPSF